MMTPLQELMQITFSGKDITPETIRAHDLADIIISVEDSLTSIIRKSNPSADPEHLVIGLVNIETGSTKLKFSSQIPGLAVSAFIALTTSIGANDYTSLPPSSVRAIQKISDFAKKRNCEAVFVVPSDTTHSAKITPETVINMPEDAFVNGETTVYGMIERVGGASPKVVIRTGANKSISCVVSEDLAKELATRLYSWMGLRGTATWCTEDYTMEEFKIEDITTYEDQSFKQNMNELSALIGKYWQDEKDVVGTVSNIRGNGI
jgi:hypothetical protein